jgi:hypothetical protein
MGGFAPSVGGGMMLDGRGSTIDTLASAVNGWSTTGSDCGGVGGVLDAGDGFPIARRVILCGTQRSEHLRTNKEIPLRYVRRLQLLLQGR